MKKFYANKTKGVYATTIEAKNVLSNDSFANELITAAFVEGKNFVVKDEKLAADLQDMFMYRVNTMINASEELGNTDALDQLKEEGKLAKDVYEWIVDSMTSRSNPLLVAEAPIEPVVIAKGINMKPEQVLQGMAARGLVINGSCKTGDREGTVLGFEVGMGGTIATILFAEGPLKMVVNDKLVGLAAVASTNTNNQSKGDVSTMKNENKGNFTLELNINEETKSVIDKAIAGDIPAYELTAEERAAMAEQKLANDLAQFAAKQEDKQEKASAVANSPAAQALLGAVVNKAGSVPAPKEEAQAPAASQGAPVVAPNQRSARQAAQTATGSNATQNKTQTNGGNVQMANQTQTRGAAQSQGTGNRSAAGAFSGTKVTGTSARQAAGAGLELNPAMAGGLVGGAWAGITPVFELPTTDFTGTNARGGQDFVWYVEEANKYEGQILDMATLAANNFANPALGITAMKFCAPESIAEFFKRDVRPEDFMWVEVFFGNTSYEFMFARNIAGDSRPYIYSRNITRKQTTGGTWYCEYVSSRRSDKLLVVMQANGVMREARKQWNREAREFQVVAEDAPFVQEVGAETWVNVAPNYGIKIGQATFIQLFTMFDEQQGLKAVRDAKVQA